MSEQGRGGSGEAAAVATAPVHRDAVSCLLGANTKRKQDTRVWSVSPSLRCELPRGLMESRGLLTARSQTAVQHRAVRAPSSPSQDLERASQ